MTWWENGLVKVAEFDAAGAPLRLAARLDDARELRRAVDRCESRLRHLPAGRRRPSRERRQHRRGHRHGTGSAWRAAAGRDHGERHGTAGSPPTSRRQPHDQDLERKLVRPHLLGAGQSGRADGIVGRLGKSTSTSSAAPASAAGHFDAQDARGRSEQRRARVEHRFRRGRMGDRCRGDRHDGRGLRSTCGRIPSAALRRSTSVAPTTASPDPTSAPRSRAAHFGTAGFLLHAALAPGVYDLAVFARSTIAGAFNNVADACAITVEAPPSNPRMWVDMPQQSDNLSQNIWVSGWALDLSSADTTAASDAVHVWAYPTDGSAPILVGAGDRWGEPGLTSARHSARRSYNNSGFDVHGDDAARHLYARRVRAQLGGERVQQRLRSSPSA